MKLWMIFIFMSMLCFGQQSVRLTPTVKAVNRALPWVVSIGTEKEVKKSDPYYARLNDYWGYYGYRIRRTRQYFPLGSGIIIHCGGYVLTNWHVVRSAEGNVIVKLYGGGIYKAVLIGFDEQSDLCLLKIENKDRVLQCASFARPDDLMLGETVITLGNPFGLDHSVSKGVLSATNRTLDVTGENYDDILQTDASINPGNSGGPLINLDGDVIGINQAIRGDAQGIGFAIPVKRLLNFIARWIMPENRSDIMTGIEVEQDILGVKVRVLQGSTAEKAGLKSGSIVKSINGISIKNVIHVSQAINECNEKTPIQVELEDGRKYVFKPVKMTDEQLIAQRLGFSVQKLTPQLNKAMDIKAELKGVVITQFVGNDMYKKEGVLQQNMKKGDLIFAVNNKSVKDLHSLAQCIRPMKSGDQVVLVCAVQIHQIYQVVKIEIPLM